MNNNANTIKIYKEIVMLTGQSKVGGYGPPASTEIDLESSLTTSAPYDAYNQPTNSGNNSFNDMDFLIKF